ncbi:hypothetical protein [Falsiroseomonas sp. E2-1-a20]|uniref:hypothetical protein n=1 Tax=Falsiroseomonas sp. E2-1-a20 TaxID=3239300 RepID=UPI003F34783E
MVEIITTASDDTVRPAELGGSSSMLPDSTGDDDRIIGSLGNDHIDGGGGYDILSYSGLGEPVRINLRDGIGRKDGAWTDTIALAGPGHSTIEQVHGTAFSDVIVGDDGDNWIRGNGGWDTLVGGAGFDVADFTYIQPQSSFDRGIIANLTDSTIAASRYLYIQSNEVIDYWGDAIRILEIEGIAGTQLRDTFLGNNDPNMFWGLGGNDALIGGGGVDAAVYLHPRSEYSVTFDNFFGQRYEVIGPEGQDTLSSVEHLLFADGGVWIEEAAGVTGIVHRFYNTLNGTHFLTASNAEANYIRDQLPAFNHEGFAFRVAGAGTPSSDIFHFYNAQVSSHFYTASEAERDYIQKVLPQYELVGVSFQAHTVNDGSKVELHRFYDAQKQSHFFTASEAERDYILANSASFKYEGVAFYVDPL